MSGETLDQIFEDTNLFKRLETLLAKPDPDLEAAKKHVQGLNIPAGAKAEAFKALCSSEKDLLRTRQRQAAERAVLELRKIGIIAHAGSPLKRASRRKQNGAASAKPKSTQSTTSPHSPPAAVSVPPIERKAEVEASEPRRGFLRRNSHA